MASTEEVLGLCTTCVHREVCTGREGFRPPVFFCEEFEVPMSVGEEPQLRARAESSQGGDRQDCSSERTGLCASCSVRATCALSNTPGGIWHCEEFR